MTRRRMTSCLHDEFPGSYIHLLGYSEDKCASGRLGSGGVALILQSDD